jgi:hypothetical protein
MSFLIFCDAAFPRHTGKAAFFWGCTLLNGIFILIFNKKNRYESEILLEAHRFSGP